MEFNIQKCEVVHMGRGNKCFQYNMNGNWLDDCEIEKDLGIIIDKNLKVSKQCLEARNRANRVLGFIARNVDYKSIEVIKKTIYIIC